MITAAAVAAVVTTAVIAAVIYVAVLAVVVALINVCDQICQVFQNLWWKKYGAVTRQELPLTAEEETATYTMPNQSGTFRITKKIAANDMFGERQSITFQRVTKQ